MKDYFLSFEFYTTTINKFWFGIVSTDLSNESLPEICKDIIDSMKVGVHRDEPTIKVIAFNNII